MTDIFVILLSQDSFKYYGGKYRKMKVLEIILFYFLSSDIRNPESRKKIVEIEFYFIFCPLTLDFR